MKIVNIFFVCLFIFSAALQYNDPDPYLWMPIYLYGALLCFLALRKKYYPSLYIGGLIFYGAYVIYLLFMKDGLLSWIFEHDAESIVQTMKAEKPWIENTREVFGLVLLMIALVSNMLWFRSRGGQ